MNKKDEIVNYEVITYVPHSRDQKAIWERISCAGAEVQCSDKGTVTLMPKLYSSGDESCCECKPNKS